MDWAQGALPMGMLFFAITILGFFRRKAGHLVARSGYPKVAENLGLEYRPSRYQTGVGSLVGRYAGFHTVVDPDDQRRIYLRFETSPRVELHTFVHNKRPPPGMRSFRPRDKRWARVFKTSHASVENQAALDLAESLADGVAKLLTIKQLKALSVTPSGVTAVFDYGSPPYIPAPVVEEALPVLAGLGRCFEKNSE